MTPHRSTYVYALATVAAVAGLLFGFDTAVINGALISLRSHFGLDTAQTERATSALLVGCVLGAGLAGWLSDRYGRRRILVASAVLFAASSVWAAVPGSLNEFLLARLLGGVAIGFASLIAPLYLAEISPPDIRGRLISMNQLAIVSGILVAYFVNWRLAAFGADAWRYMFAVAAVPSVAFLVGLLFVPESPRYLTETGRLDEALGVLTRISGAQVAAEELRAIRGAITEEAGSFGDLFAPALRRPLVIAVALAVLQQVTGINTVLYYGSILFKEYVGAGTDDSLGANVAIGFVNLLGTLFALWLIDRVGRRALLMSAAGGMAASLGVLGLAFLMTPPPGLLVLGLILLFVASFAVGLGPGAWVVMAELFPTRVRGRAMAVATVSLWMACTLVSFTFLSLVEALGPSGAFWVYGAMSVVTFLFVWWFVPETRGRSLEQIETLWKH